MEFQAGFLLSVALFILPAGIYATAFTLKNNCSFTIWPATQAGAGRYQLSSTGIPLVSNATASFDLPADWSGRIWARSGCSADDAGKFTCQTGDCASGQVSCNGAGGVPPATLVEVTLGASGGQDFYDISLVDGFNLPVSLAPQGGAGGCQATSCAADVNKVCPPELALKGAEGSVVGCKSACLALKEAQYCCTENFSSPATCLPTNYSKVFKAECPQAYSYAYDDRTSIFTCAGATNYVLTFCP
ncbi:thaumatin-like protein 1b [Malania oleifera]|uniref:thaumatin-like protein 1b n=1 Tax=Malania oleifera TaxID=397392 RepID=UPI0025ADB034|nr:thaumatin-like protein 1b [Malania oleifera]